MMLRAFARTQALRGPGRADVDLAMSKWWTKKRPAEGQVRSFSQWVSSMDFDPTLLALAGIFGRFRDYLSTSVAFSPIFILLTPFLFFSLILFRLDHENHFRPRATSCWAMAHYISQEGE